MKVPVIRGTIDRRILVNYRLDPEVVARYLPAPFRPQRVGTWTIAGICLIRLEGIRPRWIPRALGIRSENAAHRFAVTWETESGTRSGVYIPRRDTSSRLNSWAGGRLFPGVHHRARFRVEEGDGRYHVAVDSPGCHMSVTGRVAPRLPDTSVFSSLEEASRFFEQGSLGYSGTKAGNRFDGLELRCRGWQVQPLAVESVSSSFFSETFPPDAVVFDHALLMHGIEHEWHAREEICCA